MRILLVQDSTGHSTGYHVVARGLRDAGIEVLLGGVLLPGAIARMAADEGVDAIGYRIMDAAPVILVERLRRELDRHALGGLPLVVGGIVHDDDLPKLEALRVAAVFRPGVTLDEIARRVRGLVPSPRDGRS